MYFGAVIGGVGNVMEGRASLVDVAHAQGINEMYQIFTISKSHVYQRRLLSGLDFLAPSPERYGNRTPVQRVSAV